MKIQQMRERRKKILPGKWLRNDEVDTEKRKCTPVIINLLLLRRFIHLRERERAMQVTAIIARRDEKENNNNTTQAIIRTTSKETSLFSSHTGQILFPILR